MKGFGFSRKCGLWVAAGMLSVATGVGVMAQDAWAELKALSPTKTLMHLSGQVVDGKVELSFFKAQAVPKDKEKDLFKGFRIWRMEFAEPTFDAIKYNYKHYLKQAPGKAQIVFEGELKPAEGGKRFAYVDSTVKAGMTYAYWVASDDTEPLGPFPVKVRDTNVWWPAAKVVSEMTRIAKEHPDIVTVETVGHTALGRDIKAIRAGHARKCVALVGAVHAGESGPELIIPAIERLLKNDAALLEKVSIVAIPELNIDQREMLVTYGVPWYLRTNANGVDLNRNFPAAWTSVNISYEMDSSDPFCVVYKGPKAGSEPETKAVMEWVARERPQALFSFHCVASITGEDFLFGRLPDGLKDASAFRKPAEAYLKGMNQNAPLTSVYQGCNAGSFPAWCVSEMNIPGYDVEISFAREMPVVKRVQADTTDLPLLEEYQGKHFNGIKGLLSTLAVERESSSGK